MKLSLLALLLALAPLTGAHAARCPGLKSGSHVMLNPADADPDWRVNLVSVDAKNLVVTDRSGTVPLTTTEDTCRYALPDGSPLVVSPQRTLLVRLAGVDGNGWSLGMPLETPALKSLAGTWNILRQRTADGVSTTNNGQLQINGKGKVSASFCDAQGLNCSPPAVAGQLTVHPEAGFVLTDTQGRTERLFVRRAADGSQLGLMVGITNQAFTVLAPALPRPLPVAGERFAAWELLQTADGALSTLTGSQYRVQSVDAATQTVVRKRLEDCRVDALQVNFGRDGLIWRPSGSYTDCRDNLVKSFRDNLLLSLRESFGFVAFGLTAPDRHDDFFGFAISRP